MKRNNFEDYTSQFNISKDWIFPYSQIKKGSQIMLYGAGDVGQSYYNQIKYTNYCELICWIDREPQKYQQIGLDVHGLDCIDKRKYDYVVIAISDSKNARMINSFLLENGINQEKIIWNGFQRKAHVTDLDKYYINRPVHEEAMKILEYRKIQKESFEWYQYMSDIHSLIDGEDTLVIPRLVLQVTQKCSLKCHGCNNLMPLHQNPIDFDLDRVKADINNIAKKADRILVLEIIGGEPLLYKRIRELIDFIGTMKNIDVIEITTNGTIIPDDGLLDSLRELNAYIRISKYEKSNRLNELIEKCRKFEIEHMVLDNLNWLDSSSVESRELDDNELRIVYSKCISNRLCKTISNGRIFCCARAASLYDLDICRDSSNYIIIENSNKKEIRDFFRNNSARACDYCTCTDEWREVEPGS